MEGAVLAALAEIAVLEAEVQAGGIADAETLRRLRLARILADLLILWTWAGAQEREGYGFAAGIVARDLTRPG